MMALLCASATALVLLGGQRHGATATPRATPPRLAALERVAVSVGDAASAAAFYEATLGLVATADATTDDGRPRHLLGGGGSLQLELREGGADGAAAGYSAEGGYRGLVARVGNVAAAVAAARENGGTVLSESATVEHGPSSKPEEGVDVVTAVTQVGGGERHTQTAHRHVSMSASPSLPLPPSLSLSLAERAARRPARRPAEPAATAGDRRRPGWLPAPALRGGRGRGRRALRRALRRDRVEGERGLVAAARPRDAALASQPAERGFYLGAPRRRGRAAFHRPLRPRGGRGHPLRLPLERDTIASPRPPLRLGDEAVLQLRYVYSAPDVQQAGGLEALVVSSPGCGEEGVEEGKEPDEYPVVFRE